MSGIYGMAAFGALFKKKKEPSAGAAARDREDEIRKNVLDDFRGREDAIHAREAAVAAREERLEKERAELASRIQELAAGAATQRAAPAREARQKEAPARSAAPAASRGRSIRELEQHMKSLEEELEKARALHRELTALEKKRAEYLERLIGFKTRGFSVAKLEAAMGRPTDELDKAFRAFQKDVDTLVALAARCDRVDPFFSVEAGALKALCTRPEAIADVEKGIRELEARELAKRKLLMDRVGKWRSEGYVTARFERLEGASMGDLEEAILQFDADIAALRKLGARLDALGQAGAAQAAQIRPMLADPERLHELENALSRLERGQPAAVDAAGAGQPPAFIEEPDEPPAPTDPAEKEARDLIAETEKLIAGLDSAGTDPTSAENLLRMARSFARSKNFPKALEYAGKAHKAASTLKK